MFSQKTSRWFGVLIIVMLGLRIGYKYYRSQQRPDYEARMENAAARQQALIGSIQADQDAQRARGATVVLADSAVVAADSARPAK